MRTGATGPDGKPEVQRLGYFTGVTFWGGGEVYLQALVSHAARLGHRVVLFCRAGLDVSGLLAERSPSQIAIIHVDAIEKNDSVWARCHAYRRLFRSRKLDLLHFNGSDYTLPALAARLAGVPHVVATYHVTPDGERRGPRRQVKDMLYGHCLHDAIFNCEAARRQWRRFVRGPLAPELTLIHNGVDTERFTPLSPSERAAARHEWGLEEGELAVGMVARLHAMKGHNHLIDAASEVVRAYPVARFLIAGDGPLKDDIADRIARKGLVDQFRLVGFLPDPRRLIAACDVIVVPSLYKETCSLTTIEAMASGVAVVASRTGGLPEIVCDGETGRLVDAADSAQLAAALVELLADSAMRSRMGEAGRRRAARHFTSARMVDRTFGLYHRTLRPPQCSSPPGGCGVR